MTEGTLTCLRFDLERKISVTNLKAACPRPSIPLAKDLRVALFLGTAVRLALASFTAHPFDVYAWYMYCAGVLEHGLDISSILSSLRPLWFLTLIPVAYSYGFLSSITGSKATSVAGLPDRLNPRYDARLVPDPLFNFLVKAPILTADIATTIILYRVVLRSLGREKAKNVSSLFYLNPISIWTSAAWGQYESLPAFFTVLSLYMLVNEKIVSAALSLLTATLYKVYPAVFLIPVSIYLVKRVNLRSLLKYYAVFLTPMLIFLAMGGMGVVNHFFRFVLDFFSTRTFFGVFGFGLTYWSISLLYPLNPDIWAPFSSLLMVVLTSISLSYVLRARFDAHFRCLVVGTYLMIAAIFLSYRFIGETRLAWLLPFLTLMVGDKVVSVKEYRLLSLTAFAYTQKNFPYYLLPMATLEQGALNPLFEFAGPFSKVVDGALLPAPLSAAVLAILGTVFSALMLVTYIKGIRGISELKSYVNV